MLSVKNITKIYNTKGGVEVRALDDISIEFNNTGMVFLLGRSGCGKSTLLNIAGGLDVPTFGEIILNGKSSKDFTVTDFDSYRNTYVGFIFQEYNILEEFTVEQNILLALQLQNKSSDRNAVNEILSQVDLVDVNNRKPKTLSGGQRQRVAIARALIKNPKIILADEPTGALDSNTGEQIFETLKKLSKDRLVIVVSHDRGFAEKYGDRIIELSDGKVISDISKEFLKNDKTSENVTINDDVIVVKDWDRVTENEAEQIISTLKKLKKETVISLKEKELKEIKKICGVEDKENAKFLKTKPKENRDNNLEQTQFIKSRLPFRHALKLAFDGIKNKPIRLTFTILLAVIAFTFFGISSVLMMYNPNFSIADAISKSDYSNIILYKEYVAYYEQTQIGSNNTEYVTENKNVSLRTAFTQEEVDRMNLNSVGLKFAGIMDFGAYENDYESVNGYKSNRLPLGNISIDYDYARYYNVGTILGFSDCGAEYLKECGFRLLAGRYPENYKEIAIPEYIYEIYEHSKNTDIEKPNFNYNSPSEIINQIINVNGTEFTVTGVYDVGDIPSRFNELLNMNTKMDANSIVSMVTELKDLLENSFHTVVFVSPDFYEQYKFATVRIDFKTVYGIIISNDPIETKISDSRSETFLTPKSIWQNDHLVKFYDLSGNAISFPDFAETDVYISSQVLIARYARELKNELNTGKYTDEDCLLLKELLSKQDASTSRLSVKEMQIITENIFTVYEKVFDEKLIINDKVYAKNLRDEKVDLNVKGIYTFIGGMTTVDYGYAVSDEFIDKYTVENNNSGIVLHQYFTDYQMDVKKEKYGSLITATDKSMAQSYFMLSGGKNGATYVMNNAVYKTTMGTARIIYEMKLLFYASATVFGLFAALMLFNFISVSISSKNKEIGILRAVGARKIDVFSIFLIEALIITLTCFIISTILSGIACIYINAYTITSGVKISLLNYKIVNVLISFGIVVIVSTLATILPVSRAARKSPVDSIRTL